MLENMKFKSVYISVAGMDLGWIIGKIANDIKEELEKNGILCRIGKPDDYLNEDLCFHMGWAYAKPEKRAKTNSLFITHIDDKFKENLVVSLKNKFDSYIAMSPEDATFLIQLGFDKSKTFGFCLPVRNTYVRPLNLGIFSGCYKDGRKNESWVIDFCKENKNSYLLNFVLIGPGWGNFVNELEKLNCSFEWHNASRVLPYEYQFQQMKLKNMDYYFYVGMDGGAMGSYDGYAYGNRLLITDDGFHKGIPNIDFSFATYDEFYSQLDVISKKQQQKIVFFKENTPENYVKKILAVWNGGPISIKTLDNEDIASKRRANYFPFSFRRLLGSIKRKFLK